MKECLFISEAAKEIQVESHVLRYWEEELKLPIRRNDLGHRYYTAEDVERFRQIKDLKERGLQLRTIKMLMKNGGLEAMGTILPGKMRQESAQEAQETCQERQEHGDAKETVQEGQGAVEAAREAQEHGDAMETNREAQKTCQERQENGVDAESVQEPWKPQRKSRQGMQIEILEVRDARRQELQETAADAREERFGRLRWLLCQMIRETMQESDQELRRAIREDVAKELEDQFRRQEERQEKRDREQFLRGEEYYRRIDELLRKKLSMLQHEEKPKKGKKKRHFIF